ncbi:MAG: restriction endonuclease subunit S [Bryobacterales bacterium]|nr:restriction endonuclease subunit S [Bryobacterales bacterium]
MPEHWSVRRLKYVVSFTGGGTPSKANASFWSGNIPWVSPKDMTRARLNDTVDHISNDAVATSAVRIIAPGAVLVVVRSGILRRTIPVAINSVPMALNQDMKALSPNPRFANSDYLRLLIQGNQPFLLKEWTKQGATVESIEHGLMANSRLPIPPLSEQTAIACFIEHADRRIRGSTQSARRFVELLNEFRTGLIADVVTGKLDVREAAAKLSDVDSVSAGGRDGTIQVRSVLHATEPDIAKGAVR